MALATGSTIRLGIDCRLSGSAHAGIGRYTENLIRCLLGIFGFNQELPHSWKLTCFFYSQEQALQVLGENGLIHPQLKVVITPIKHYTLAEQFQLPAHYSQAKLDLLHVPHFNIPLLYSGAIHITIHDLLWHSQHGLEVTTLPNWIYWLKYAGYKFITQQAVTKASRVFVPSEFVKQDVIKHYPKSSEKIVITPEGINQSYLKMRDQLLANQVHNLPTPKPIIYYTGSLYPHKNIEVVLKALTDLPQISLVIAGSRSVFVERTKKMISQLGLTKQVTFAGFVDDAQLISDYQS
ncbi:MAG: Glycosyl transferase group 1, partial [Parcubacteria group bacterium GW2011_GWF2_44_8]